MRILSGIQPSGSMHVGNYLGAVRQWVTAQNPDAYYCIVDLHALTLQIEPDRLREQTLDYLASLLAAGLDPAVCTLFVQSQVSYHAQMNWLLECVATYGELSRMTQFKEKAARQEGYRVGLLTYPVLMAGDILLYSAQQVPVGDDQRQHLELTREIAERFNNRYGEVFTVPVGVQPSASARVMDLQEPTRKMSKSLASPLGLIYLNDDPRDIDKKIKKAVTDTDNEVRLDWEKKPGVSNLLEMYASFAGESPTQVADRYERYGDLKKDLSELVITSLEPFQRRYRELRADEGALRELAARGAEKASAVAGPLYERAATAMGL
ncbi:MAG: tryptophan--tRNA ligase [Actinomycetota bacterium]|jgi:tryptophanyl-tRNA synthetase|nr:tryptophan--tRNA ligase [Actinomycetota bacterium]